MALLTWQSGRFDHSDRIITLSFAHVSNVGTGNGSLNRQLAAMVHARGGVTVVDAA